MSPRRQIDAAPVRVPAGAELLDTPERGLYEANAFFFQPIEESVRDLETYLRPDGRVLAVAAYGGYPSYFAGGGAERVVAVDVDPRQVGWNLLLREGVRHFDYETGLSYFAHSAGADERAAMRMEMLGTIPPEHRSAAEAMAIAYEAAMGSLARQATKLYPHVRDRNSWDTAQRLVQRGGWEVHRAELVELAERLAEEESGTFDTLYLSSVRNWTLYHSWLFNPHRAELFGQYDTRLSESARTLLGDGGVIYETLIDDGVSAFPRVPIDPERYPGFAVTRHPSTAGPRHEVVLAKRGA